MVTIEYHIILNDIIVEHNLLLLDIILYYGYFYNIIRYYWIWFDIVGKFWIWILLCFIGHYFGSWDIYWYDQKGMWIYLFTQEIIGFIAYDLIFFDFIKKLSEKMEIVDWIDKTGIKNYSRWNQVYFNYSIVFYIIFFCFIFFCKYVIL